MLRNAGMVSFAVSAFAKHRFVATNGDDTNPGTIGSPFVSVSMCVGVSLPGDVCQVRKGTYTEDSATIIADEPPPRAPQSPITITAYGNERVRFSGLERLNKQWTKVAGTECIYSTHVGRPVSQLFVGDEMQTSARWPNAYWKDMSVFNSSTVYAEGNLSASSCGVTTAIKSLAAYTESTAVNVSGSLAVMNIGSWISYTLPVTQTAPGTLSYECPPKKPHKRDSTRFFLEGKMEFVDSETEWAYNPDNGEIRFWPEACTDPNKLQVSGKVASYFLSGRKSGLTFKNIEFFGLTFNLTHSMDLTIDSCNFQYPVYSNRMLGGTDVTSSFWWHSRGLSFVNNTVAYTDGQFLMQKFSQNSSFENNHFHHLDFSCSGYSSGNENHAGVVNLNDWDSFRWNTVHDIGPSSAVRAGTGALVEYNLIHDTYSLQHDGSLFQLVGTPAPTCRFNWAFNSEKCGYRFDRENDPNASFGSGGVLHRNIGWNVSAAFVKGDRHTISNNVFWTPVVKGVPDMSASEMALMVIGPGEAWYTFDFENVHTTVTRNGAPSMGCGRKNHSFPGPSSHNRESKVENQLVDVLSRDFRPKAGSTFDVAGVGPYKADGSDYFIPGQRLHAAAHPIPSDGALDTPASQPLFFKPGFEALEHEVYLAEVGAKLQRVFSSTTVSHFGLGAHMVKAPQLQSGTTYQWRVVTRHASHDVEGSLWTFSTASAADTTINILV